MSLKQYFRRNAYRWHRITSLVVALPILLWTISGFLHPVMNSFKPDVRNQQLPVSIIDTSKIRLTLNEAIAKHQIKQLDGFRIVKLFGAHYYQVRLKGQDTLSYISCYNAQWLPHGDEQYAAYLAQRYLTEPNGKKSDGGHHGEVSANISEVTSLKKPAAHYEKPNISNVSLIRSFDQEYKKSNLLLPVYKVNFQRADGIRLYIETSSDRMATSMDDKRAWYTAFFSFAHSWSFLNGLGDYKYLLLGAFSFLCFLSSVFGFYIYNITKRKNAVNSTQKLKNRHRIFGNIFVATTLLYALSGGWHSLHKIGKEDPRKNYTVRNSYSVEKIDFDPVLASSYLKNKEKLFDASIVQMDGENYWQLSISKEKEKYKRYIAVSTGKELVDGDNKYGCYLACNFSGSNEHNITHSQCLKTFTNKYSMMNKRLPVIEVGFEGGENYYVETSSSTLSAVVDPTDRMERFSFSNLHMHHYWEDWLGKSWGKTMRNSFLIATTLGLLLLALTGMLLYLKKKRAMKRI